MDRIFQKEIFRGFSSPQKNVKLVSTEDEGWWTYKMVALATQSVMVTNLIGIVEVLLMEEITLRKSARVFLHRNPRTFAVPIGSMYGIFTYI